MAHLFPLQTLDAVRVNVLGDARFRMAQSRAHSHDWYAFFEGQGCIRMAQLLDGVSRYSSTLTCLVHCAQDEPLVQRRTDVGRKYEATILP
jgi:hypothetical protein